MNKDAGVSINVTKMRAIIAMSSFINATTGDH